ncbi:hypothetical protein CLAIMM_08506 isoform 2, partial [Cladophialophora immunda]
MQSLTSRHPPAIWRVVRPQSSRINQPQSGQMFAVLNHRPAVDQTSIGPGHLRCAWRRPKDGDSRHGGGIPKGTKRQARQIRSSPQDIFVLVTSQSARRRVLAFFIPSPN